MRLRMLYFFQKLIINFIMKIKIFKLIMFIAFASIIFVNNSFAQNFMLIPDKKLINNHSYSFNDNNYSNNLNYENISAHKQIIPLNQNYSNNFFPSKSKFYDAEQNLQTKKKKSVGLAILLSAILPGAGEFYGENYLKAGIFFGVELLAWGTYFYFENKGDKKTDEYKAYADTYWSVRTYARWLKNEGFEGASAIDPDEPDLNVLRLQIIECERQNFSHTLPEYGSQQYYELIGKYQNFQAGWTNLQNIPTRAPGPYNYMTYKDPVFINYAKERQKANDFYDYAKIGPITAIVNHILSAADAAWVVSNYNKKITVQTGFRINNKISPYTYKYKQIPTFNVAVNF